MKVPFRHPNRTNAEKMTWWRVFVGTVAVIVLLSSFATNVVLVAVVHSAHVTAKAVAAENKATADQNKRLAGGTKEALAYIAYLTDVNSVTCTKLHQINPSDPQCPALPPLLKALIPTPRSSH